MNRPKKSRFFWQALSFVLLLVVMFGAGFFALKQTRSLRDGASHLQTRLAPLAFGLIDLDAHFAALRNSEAMIRAQLQHHPHAPHAQPILPEPTSPELYIARINARLQQMAELDLGITQRVEFFSVRNSLDRFFQRHAEYRALVAAGDFDKAASYFDHLLLAKGNDIAARISAMIDSQRRAEADYLAGVEQRFQITFWTIIVNLGLAISACLLVAGWQLRGSWLRRRRAALYAAMSEGGSPFDPRVEQLVEASRQLHALTVQPSEAGHRPQ